MQGREDRRFDQDTERRFHQGPGAEVLHNEAEYMTAVSISRLRVITLQNGMGPYMHSCKLT